MYNAMMGFKEKQVRQFDASAPESSPCEGGASGSDGLEEYLTTLCRRLLEDETIGPEDNVFERGGDSITAVELLSEVERALGLKLDADVFFRAPTTRGLTRAFQKGDWSGHRARVAVLQPHGSRPPLVLMPGMGCNVLGYFHLCKHLGQERPVYGLQIWSADEREAIPTLEALAAHYVTMLREFQPEGPYQLAGYSYGGMLAFEMARQLVAEGQAVAYVGLIDTKGKGYGSVLTPSERIVREVRALGRTDLSHLPAHVYQRWRELSAGVRYHFIRRVSRSSSSSPSPGSTAQSAIHRLAVADRRARWAYRPKPYPGRIHLLRAERQPTSEVYDYGDPHMGWSGLAQGGIVIHPVPGDHASILDEPAARVLAAQMLLHLA
jgi:thioesterase domain-containing protein/acyl carrier protein